MIAYIWAEILDPWLVRRRFKGRDIDDLFEEHENIVETLERLAETQNKTNEHLEKLIDVLEKGKK